jgi:hypothetical protein
VTELTLEELEKDWKRAVMETERKMSPGELRTLLDMAAKSKAFAISHVHHLHGLLDCNEIILRASDPRILLMLALQAKRGGVQRTPSPSAAPISVLATPMMGCAGLGRYT